MSTTIKTQISLEQVLVSYKIMIAFFVIFIILMIVLMLTNKNGFNKYFGYEIFITVPIFLLVAYLIKEIFSFKNNPSSSLFSKLSQSNEKWFIGAVSIFILLLGIFGVLMMLYVGGIFSNSPPENNTAMIINFVIIVSFITISSVIYNKYKNKDNENLNTLPKAMQDAFHLRSKYTAMFAFFIMSVMILYFINPWGLMTNYGGPVVFFTLFAGITMIIMITIYQYFLANPSKGYLLASTPTPLEFIMKGLYILCALGISFGLIYGLLKILGVFNQDDKKLDNWGNVIFNLILLCSMLGMIYKLANAGGFLDKNPYYRLFLNTLLYIPCLLVNVTNIISQILGFSKNSNGVFEPPKPFEIKMLVLGLVLLGGYYIWFFFAQNYIKSSYLKQGGKQLINQPIDINVLTNVVSYQQLSESDKLTYQYALSFWFYLDAFPQTTYNKVKKILSYGDNPSISYSSTNNTLYITIKQDVEEGVTNNPPNGDNNGSSIHDAIEMVKSMPFGNETDTDGHRIIYKHSDVQLQKWNHILLNYNGGTLDVFYNGELVKSAIEVVPYMNFDMLTVGSENGVSGNIANLMYFKQPLDYYTVNTLYTSLKHNNPPVIPSNNSKLIPL